MCVYARVLDMSEYVSLCQHTPAFEVEEHVCLCAGACDGMCGMRGCCCLRAGAVMAKKKNVHVTIPVRATITGKSVEIELRGTRPVSRGTLTKACRGTH